MTQYRIIEKYDNFLRQRKFYTQIKTGFFWRSLNKSKDQILDNYYDTYDEAKDFIISRMPKVLFHCVEHPNSKEPKIYHIN